MMYVRVQLFVPLCGRVLWWYFRGAAQGKNRGRDVELRTGPVGLRPSAAPSARQVLAEFAWHVYKTVPKQLESHDWSRTGVDD
eukprot:4899667-Amphidinium_carterae.1